MRLIGLFILFCLSISFGKDLQFRGILEDSVFNASDSLDVELLESGEVQNHQYGDSLVFSLPADTSWNLCVKSVALNRCYHLVYYGTDSVFSGVVGIDYSITLTDTLQEIQNSNEKNTEVVQADTAEFVAEMEKQKDESAVRLRKVSLRLRRTPKRTLGKSTISAKSIKRMPGLAEADVIRSIQALPGVVASSDFSTKLYVRGGGADQNLFLLDNSVVYSPVHFFGLFSTFLVEGIDQVEFYKGGFPPKYGNRLSSVIDIQSRNGGNDTANSWFKGSSVKISTFATQVHTEGRYDSLSWLFAGRTTYIKQILDLLSDAKVIDFSLDYHFTDLQGNVKYAFGKDRWLRFSWYGGEDRLDFSPFNASWGNLLYPLNFNWRFNKDWTSHFTLSYSRFKQGFGIENFLQVGNDIVTKAVKSSLLFEGMKNHKIQGGLDVLDMKTRFSNEQIIFDINLEDIVSFRLYSPYVQDTWTVGNFEIIPGFRFNWLDATEEAATEPRMSVSWKPSKMNQMDFHVGYYKQYINSIIFGDQETLNEFYYPSTKATHQIVPPSNSLLFATGWTRSKLFDDYTFILEGYYKTQNDLLIFAPEDAPDSITQDPNSRLGDFFKAGEGYSLGWEVSLKKEVGAISGDINFSQGYSVLLEQGDSLSYFPDWHQPFSLKSTLSLNWKGKDGLYPHKIPGRYFRSSTQIKLASGLPYTENKGYVGCHSLDQGESSAGPPFQFQDCTQVIQGNRNASFVPSYFRWDLKLVDVGKENKWNFSWTILNITGHENVFLLNYDTSTNPPTKQVVTQFPFFPILLNYEYYF